MDAKDIKVTLVIEHQYSPDIERKMTRTIEAHVARHMIVMMNEGRVFGDKYPPFRPEPDTMSMISSLNSEAFPTQFGYELKKEK